MSKAKQFIKENFAEILFSIPKTVWFNFKVLPFRKAVKFPIVISHHIKVKGVNRNNFILRGGLPTASIRVGFGHSLGSIRENKKGLISIKNDGKIILEGKAGFSRAVIHAVNGETNKMIAFKRVDGEDYKIECVGLELSTIANEEKMIPQSWITADGTNLTEDFVKYALPLIQGEPDIRRENGLTSYAKLKMIPFKI